MNIAYRNDNTAWASVDAGQKHDYQVLSVFDTDVVNRRNGTTLRGRLFSHVLDKRKKYVVTWSADVLVDSDDRDFMRAFFGAMEQALYIDSVWVDVQIEGGDEPIEFIEGHVDFWEYKFVFLSVEPS